MMVRAPFDVVAARAVPATDVRQALASARRVVFLDDDPTGTQTVCDLPVLTRWSVADIAWALRQSTAGFFVLTNTRSLGTHAAAERVRQVVQSCLQAAEPSGLELVFASRSDSTLRGHFPLETDVIGESVAARYGPVDGVLLAPAYIDAGRVTVNGVHLVQTGTELIPVGDSEFARDATFGYQSSRLADWVSEKSDGRISPEHVIELPLEAIRTESTKQLAARLSAARDGQVVVVDAASDDDLRATALALLDVERDGKRFIYRIGPSFVRARVGQQQNPPIDDATLADLVTPGGHGLVVVGSHVGLTSRQLDQLSHRRRFVNLELDVPTILAGGATEQQRIQDVVTSAAEALGTALVVVSTSRTVITGGNKATSLEISRQVSAALTRVVRDIVALRRPAFIVAKGGITSSDIATDALSIDRAWVRGSVLPGIVSLWDPVSGPAAGLPYVVFAGNVGDDSSLADVVDRLAGSA